MHSQSVALSGTGVSRSLSLGPALGRLRRGKGDPTHRVVDGCWWRATRTPQGPALMCLDVGRGEARAWGEGAEWVLERVPTLLGAGDDPSGFRPRHPVLTEALRRHPGLRVGRTEAVWEAYAPACLEQRVTGKEAFAAYRSLVRRYGEPAPGPAREQGSAAAGMMCPPTPQRWARIPSWEWLKAGVDLSRSRPVVLGAGRAAALERTLHRGDADRGLRSLPGVGAWTSAEVRQRAHGDPDAWSDGDYHIPGLIGLALVGEELSNDDCRELLEPYAGHRYRVQLLVESMHPWAPRRGPRRTLPTHLPG